MRRTATSIIASITLGLLESCTPVKNAASSKRADSVAAMGGNASPGATDGVSTDGGAVRVAETQPPHLAGSGASPPPVAGSFAGRGAAGASGTGVQAADAGPTSSGPIRGQVIDFYRQPVATVQVTVGASTTTTDERGAFEVADVPETYDLQLLLGEPGIASAPREVWAFEGLTRRDRVLPVSVPRTLTGSTQISRDAKTRLPRPRGQTQPRRAEGSHIAFLRDPMSERS